jgi:hypothetical protein
MNFKPHKTTLIISLFILSFISYLLSVNIWYGFTHKMIFHGDVASQTLNYTNIIILILFTLLLSYSVTIFIQNLILNHKNR